MAVHVRSNSWFICFPSSAKQQHQMTNFQGFWQQNKTIAIFFLFPLGTGRMRSIFSRGKF